MQIQTNSHIQLVKAEDIRHLRHKMLRQGKEFSTTNYKRDDMEDTFHLGVFAENEIVSCATFYPENTDKLHAKNAYRLRGMATDINYSRNGYGRKIMKKAFTILKSKNCDVLWCNARLKAVPFYKSIGMKEIGKLFEISDIGPHYFMYKKL